MGNFSTSVSPLSCRIPQRSIFWLVVLPLKMICLNLILHKYNILMSYLSCSFFFCLWLNASFDSVIGHIQFPLLHISVCTHVSFFRPINSKHLYHRYLSPIWFEQDFSKGIFFTYSFHKLFQPWGHQILLGKHFYIHHLGTDSAIFYAQLFLAFSWEAAGFFI